MRFKTNNVTVSLSDILLTGESGMDCMRCTGPGANKSLPYQKSFKYSPKMYSNHIICNMSRIKKNIYCSNRLSKK